MVQHGIVCNIATAACQNLDDPAGIGTTTLNGVNDKGQIVGFYVDGNDNTIGLLAIPVPEPASLALLASVSSASQRSSADAPPRDCGEGWFIRETQSGGGQADTARAPRNANEPR